MVNEKATEGFSRGANEYEQARPGYPAGVLDLLERDLGLRRGARVCDLAAGTGKLTRQLVAAGADVTAVEPVAEMRAQLATVLAEFAIVDGTAEAMPLPDSSFDLVTVAQAFHWFDARPALVEIARVLRPGGGLAMIWNVRDESVDWVRRFTELIIERSDGVPYRRDYTFDYWSDQVSGVGTFSPLVQAEFENPQLVDLELVVRRAASTSFVSVLPDDRREALLDEMREMLVGHPDVPVDEPFVFPHQTDVYWCLRQA